MGRHETLTRAQRVWIRLTRCWLRGHAYSIESSGDYACEVCDRCGHVDRKGWIHRPVKEAELLRLFRSRSCSRHKI